MPENGILVVDDEEGIRTQLKWALAKDYEVFLAGDIDSARKIMTQKSPNLILLDISLTPDMGAGTEGMQLLQEILSFDNTIKVIMITGNDSRENARKSVVMGAYDFYSKPIDVEEVKISIKRDLHIQSLERENKRLLEDLERSHEFREIISSCNQMEEVLNVVRRVSTTDATVLIQGESGTGKELIARAIHYNSTRKDKPFIPVNCSAIPENLLESELFGHEKGAFTDAYAQKKGKLELAQNGTVFLDEIAEMPFQLQAKILRTLQEHEIERLGGSERIKLDVRVLAATNRDIKKEVEEKRFRKDLYYRLNVISINLPPLRERGEDVILLANAFLNRFKKEMRIDINGFTEETLKAIRDYDWLGNVRELENKVRRAIIMANGAYIKPEDMELAYNQPRRMDLKETRDTFESNYIQEALLRSKGNVNSAAEALGVTRTTLYSLISKYNLDNKEYSD